MGIYGHNFGDLKIQEITNEEALEANLVANCALVEFYEDDSLSLKKLLLRVLIWKLERSLSSIRKTLKNLRRNTKAITETINLQLLKILIR